MIISLKIKWNSRKIEIEPSDLYYSIADFTFKFETTLKG